MVLKPNINSRKAGKFFPLDYWESSITKQDEICRSSDGYYLPSKNRKNVSGQLHANWVTWESMLEAFWI